jgi:hypothetical protein
MVSYSSGDGDMTIKQLHADNLIQQWWKVNPEPRMTNGRFGANLFEIPRF